MTICTYLTGPLVHGHAVVIQQRIWLSLFALINLQALEMADSVTVQCGYYLHSSWTVSRQGLTKALLKAVR